MKYLLLVSRGGFAEGLKTSLAMFVEDKMDQVTAVGLKNGKTVDDFVQDFRQAIPGLIAEDSVTALVDIVGGSPLTTTYSVLDEFDKLNDAVILGSMNLSMAITSAVTKDASEGDAFVQAVLSEARATLREFKIVSDDEEDDI